MALTVDIKYAFRVHAKHAGVTSVAVLTMSVTIAAVTTVFSIVSAVLLKPLPYPDAERIVIPWRLAPKDINLGYNEIPWGIGSFHTILHESRSFRSVAAFKPESFNLTGTGRPVLIEGARVSAEFFDVLGVHPALGRVFTSLEDTPGHEREVLLSDDVWQREFHRSPAVIGHTAKLNGQAYLIVGIMPPRFTFPRGEEMPSSFAMPHRSEFWTPLAFPAVAAPYTPDDVALVARLRDGISLTQAQAEMRLLARRMEREVPEGAGWFNSRVTPLAKQIIGETRTPLLLMLSAAVVVLLIACSNIANLILARSLGRFAEFSLRAALGAARARIVTQLVIESLVLAVLGGGLGILAASESIRQAKLFGPPNLPRLQDATLDSTVLAFAIAVTLFSTLFFGLIPAFAATRSNLAKTLRIGCKGTPGAIRTQSVRTLLLRLEVGLAFLLMIASSLIAQTFLHLLDIDPGFRADHVLTFGLSLPPTSYADIRRIVGLYQQALQRLNSIPSVEAVGLTQILPMDGATDGSRVRFPGRTIRGDQYPIVNYTIASPGYFSATRTPILRGRPFLDSDTARSQPVTIINQEMAKKFWPEKNPLGDRFALAADEAPLMTIVGVVADMKHTSLRESSGPEIYVPFTQNPFPSMQNMHFVVRSKGDPASLSDPIRAQIRSLDPELPLAKLCSLQTIVSASTAVQRFAMLSLGAFAGVSLFLAVLGLYGAISFSTNQRVQEMGIRTALGARQSDILTMVLREGARLALEGIALGILAALALTRVMAASLYGVRPVDGRTFALVTMALFTVSLLACYLPARRATKIDPLVCLRCN